MPPTILSPLPEALVSELVDLYRLEWWSAARTEDEVRRMLTGPSTTFAAVAPTGELVGFARALSDGAYLAVVLDVIIRPDHRGGGLGRRIVQTILDDARLSGIHSVELVCQPELVPFYEPFGFTSNVGQSLLMRRTADPTLTS